MTTIKRMSTIALFVAAALLGPGKAFAENVVYSPFGDAPIWVMVGMNGGFAKAVWMNRNTGACAVDKLGTGGLATDYLVVGGSGADRMYVLGSSIPSRIHCGLEITALVYNGHYVDIAGLDSPEVVDINMQLLVSGAGETWVFGGNGRDWIVGGSPMGRMLAGPGADVVNGLSFISNDWLEGQEGSDCMQDDGDAHFYFHCGSGWDSYVLGQASGSISCEIPADFCGG